MEVFSYMAISIRKTRIWRIDLDQSVRHPSPINTLCFAQACRLKAGYLIFCRLNIRLSFVPFPFLWCLFKFSCILLATIYFSYVLYSHMYFIFLCILYSPIFCVLKTFVPYKKLSLLYIYVKLSGTTDKHSASAMVVNCLLILCRIIRHYQILAGYDTVAVCNTVNLTNLCYVGRTGLILITHIILCQIP